MKNYSESIDPIEIYEESVDLAKKSDEYVVQEKKQKYNHQLNLKKDEFILILLKILDKYIDPSKKKEFDLVFTINLQNYILRNIDLLLNCSDGNSDKAKNAWRTIREKIEKTKRRRELITPLTKHEFIAATWWMTQQGDEEDLDLLRKVIKTSPFTDKKVLKTLEITTEKLINRVQSLGWRTFTKKLPELLTKARGKWIAFYGNRQVTIKKNKLEVYRLLEKKDILQNAVLVRRIEPLSPPMDMRRLKRHTKVEGN